MSDPARQYQTPDLDTRPTPGPLRDWLAAMKAATVAQPTALSASPAPQSAKPPEADKAAEPVQTWTPRVVAAPAPTAAPKDRTIDSDVSDLMAENLMLKAQLKIETDRYDGIQSLIAEELRKLRSQVEAEMTELNEVRADRDRLADLHAVFVEELDDARAQAEREAEALEKARDERDLWMARAEALAQPLFQRR